MVELDIRRYCYAYAFEHLYSICVSKSNNAPNFICVCILHQGLWTIFPGNNDDAISVFSV